MNRYALTQVLSLSSCSLALFVWYFFPGHDLYADQFVEIILSTLQLAIVPNAFLAILSAIVSLTKKQLKALSTRFVSTVFLLWGMVTLLLLILWGMLSIYSDKPTVLATFSVKHLGVTILIPAVMLLAIILGVVINLAPSFRRFIPVIRRIQSYSAILFDYIFLIIPLLVFFVFSKFLTIASFEHSMMALSYFLLSLSFVSTILVLVFPMIYRLFLGTSYARYFKLASPVCLITFLAGDSIAAIPLITHAVEQEQGGDLNISRILTVVAICFPWVGELANLIFPIYSATLEGFGFSTVLSIVSVGPFFMFTDPYISIPTLLGAFSFPENYKVTYLTLALLTDHMFEVCESAAVLFVVLRLKSLVDRTATQ